MKRMDDARSEAVVARSATMNEMTRKSGSHNFRDMDNMLHGCDRAQRLNNGDVFSRCLNDDCRKLLLSIRKVASRRSLGVNVDIPQQSSPNVCTAFVCGPDIV